MTICMGLNVDVKLRSFSGPLCGAQIDTSILMKIHLLEGYGISHANGYVMYQTIYLKIYLILIP